MQVWGVYTADNFFLIVVLFRDEIYAVYGQIIYQGLVRNYSASFAKTSLRSGRGSDNTLTLHVRNFQVF
jgi:hypothetical protein